MLAQGFDCPALNRVFCIHPFSSSNWMFQLTGRPARTHIGKRGACVIDYIDKGPNTENKTLRRTQICKLKGLTIVIRKEKEYLTNEDKALLF